MEVDDLAMTEDLKGVVVESKPGYVFVELNQKGEHGVSADLDDQLGLLDAGIPHYGWMGVHAKKAPSKDGAVKLCGRKIGTVRFVHSNMCVAECYNPVFRLLKKENLPLSGQWIFTPNEDAIHFILSSSMRIMIQNLKLSLLLNEKTCYQERDLRSSCSATACASHTLSILGSVHQHAY